MVNKDNHIEIVYVQIGTAKAPHLIANIKLVRSMFPNILINCVVTKNSISHNSLPEYVNAIIYKPNNLIDSMLNKKSIDINFRDGFWRFTFERLLALHEAHICRPKSSLIHIESDIFIFPNFPFNRFKEINSICWLPFNEFRDAASLMYFPTLSKSLDFHADLKNLLVGSKQINDMEALRTLRAQFPQKYRLLPSSDVKFRKLTNLSNNEDLRLRKVFDGIFDSAPIGMWLTGIDPRNNFGITHFFATNTIKKLKTMTNPSAYPLYLLNEGNLVFKNGSKLLNVYNLHVHSKSKKIFSNTWRREITRLTKLSNKNRHVYKFSFTVLIELLTSNFRKGTLLAYLYNSPLIVGIRKNSLSLFVLKKLNYKSKKL